MNLEVYTDGSWDNVNKSGGWAYLVQCNDKQAIDSGFFPNTTNNAMELYAIVKALDIIAHNIIPKGYNIKNVSIHSDSKYCVDSIKRLCLSDKMESALSQDSKLKHKAKFVKIRDLINEINCHISIHHVSGHTNNELNNQVDYLAVKARHEGYRAYLQHKSELVNL